MNRIVNLKKNIVIFEYNKNEGLIIINNLIPFNICVNLRD